MKQPTASRTERRVPPSVAIGVLLLLVLIAGAGLWYFMGGGTRTTVLTNPTFEPGGIMTNEWLSNPRSTGIRRTDPNRPDQWRIKAGQAWIDVVRADGKLRFQMNNARRGWGRGGGGGGGGSNITREQNDMLRIPGLITGNPNRYRYLNLTRQQLDTLRSMTGSPATDLPTDSLAAMTEAWPKFENSTGRDKEQAEERIVQLATEIPPKQQQAIAARLDLIRRTLTAEQIALYQRGPIPASRPASRPATAPAAIPPTTGQLPPATRPATAPATAP